MEKWYLQNQNLPHTVRRLSRPIGANRIRRAKIQSGGVVASSLTCKLLDHEGNEIGDSDDEITVYPVEGSVPSDLAAGDVVLAFRDVNGRYYFAVAGSGDEKGVTRRAKIQSGGVGTTTLTCKLLDSDGNETGDAITVYPVEHLGSNNLSGDVWGDYSANDIVSVFKDLNGTWYTVVPFDDTTDCDA